ncbi:MAG: type II secretion system GspH family protein [Synergistaceae bacterium]|jgi:prepilin-type N-terminal cleavage/methylation domain-containing protein|nr:type II secretion system GspH family protein [Synergistaceae bacterium]
MSVWARKKGFSLVELLLVIVILAILSGVVMLSLSSGEVIDAQTEARQLVRSLQSVRSSWLAYYADKNEMLGLPGGGIYAANSPLVRSLEIYADREALRDDVTKYGGSLVVRSFVDSGGARPLKVYIGYQGSWKLEQKNAEVKRSIKKLLAESDFGLLGADYKKYAFTESDNQTVLLRMR